MDILAFRFGYFCRDYYVSRSQIFVHFYCLAISSVILMFIHSMIALIYRRYLRNKRYLGTLFNNLPSEEEELNQAFFPTQRGEEKPNQPNQSKPFLPRNIYLVRHGQSEGNLDQRFVF